MRVKLFTFTPNPDMITGVAARSCWSERSADEILNGASADEVRRSLEGAIERGHASVAEHVTFTFTIEGISRVCSHQLVRHRIASYSQQSQRHVKPKDGSYIIPPTIAADEKAREMYEDLADRAWDCYAKLLEGGIPEEDARYVLPSSTKTNLVMTMNARSLMNFFELRCCLKAQWEIRELAHEILRQVKEVAPLLFKNAGPACKSKGICPEGDAFCNLYKKYIDQ